MKVKFQADADLNEAIVMGVRRREPLIDFQTASFAGLSGLNDWEVLALAAAEGRVLVSHDRRTMPHHFARFLESGRNPGLVIVSQRAHIGTVIDDLVLVWSATEADDWVNQLVAVPL